MPDQAIPQHNVDAPQVEHVEFIVTSRRYADAKYGERVTLAHTAAVDALVEGGHLRPVTEEDNRPSEATTEEEQ